jgi:ribosomal protein L37AE/L43A
MGLILSYFLKKDNNINQLNNQLNNQYYCNICNKTYLFNEYNKHIYQCKKNNLRNCVYGDL